MRKKKGKKNLYNITRKIVKQTKRLCNQCMINLRDDDGWHTGIASEDGNLVQLSKLNKEKLPIK